MGHVKRVAQFWRSFLVVSVPLAALPLLFVHSEEKVNIALTTTTTMMTGRSGLACTIHTEHCLLSARSGIYDEGKVCLTSLALSLSRVVVVLVGRGPRRDGPYVDCQEREIALLR